MCVIGIARCEFNTKHKGGTGCNVFYWQKLNLVFDFITVMYTSNMTNYMALKMKN